MKRVILIVAVALCATEADVAFTQLVAVRGHDSRTDPFSLETRYARPVAEGHEQRACVGRCSASMRDPAAASPRKW